MLLRRTNHDEMMFNLSAASRITATSVPALRTMIARGLVHYLGDRPLAGAERRFGVVGIYEIALIDELERNGLTQAAASQVIKAYFESEITVAAGMLACACGDLSTMGEDLRDGYRQLLTESGIRKHPEVDTTDVEAIRGFVAANPQLWLGFGSLSGRDLSRPQLLVFAYPDDYDTPLSTTADGWAEVPAKVIEMQRDVRVFNRSTTEELRKFRDSPQPWLPDEHPDAQSGIPVFHILNVTAVLVAVDRRIAENQAD